MKKIFIAIASVVTATAVYAASTTITVPANTSSNLFTVNQSGYGKITSIIAGNANPSGTVTLSLWDNSTASLWITNPAYSSIVSYATNYILSWTNYFGVVNSWTNFSLANYTNSVAATSNAIPFKATITVPAAGSIVLNPVSYIFDTGAWITNSSSSNATITVNFTQ